MLSYKNEDPHTAAPDKKLPSFLWMPAAEKSFLRGAFLFLFILRRSKKKQYNKGKYRIKEAPL